MSNIATTVDDEGGKEMGNDQRGAYFLTLVDRFR